MVLLLILILPLAGGAAIAAGRGRPSAGWLGWLGVAANGAGLALGIWVAIRVVRAGPLIGAGGLLRADALSAFMVVVIGTVALLASWLGIRTLALELAAGQATRARATTYGVLVQAF
ncbi:MAG TPA: hypothetical protein VND67_11080, partial [Acidimicrobiales bacterium]|nr:hypothetical protein [Acidimicrobiales bacterium]